jgi:hypothetical protein
MKQVTLPIAGLALIAGTRAMLGGGFAFLAADCMSDEPRRAGGWSLLAVGGISTVPLAADVLGQARDSAKSDRHPGGNRRNAMMAESR